MRTITGTGRLTPEALAGTAHEARKASQATRVHTRAARALVPEGKPATAFQVKASAADKAIALAGDIRNGRKSAHTLAAEIIRRGKMARTLAKASKADRATIVAFLEANGLA